MAARSVHVLLVAAGRGVRFGGPIPKQYQRLAGRPVLRRTAERFLSHPRIDRVFVAIHPDHAGLYDGTMAGVERTTPVVGGDERQESVRAGLEAIAATTGGADARVLIHDGVRPLVSAAVIDRVIDGLDTHDGAIAALPVVDTLRRGVDGLAGETVPRDGLWRAQTPQGFGVSAILSAHRALAGAALTDDAAIAERAGLRVALVLGEEENLKVTSEPDLARAERLLASHGACAAPWPDVRVGNGYDVHRLGAPGSADHVMLCGIPVPHDRGLLGHSDADVGLHALTDALLGALALGDIGQHFPPTDDRWKGAASDQFLRHAVDLATGRGAIVTHADLTLVCERPKIGPHRAVLQASVARILALDPTRVSVKATTSERLGFTGRSEGIAAQATVTLVMPG